MSLLYPQLSRGKALSIINSEILQFDVLSIVSLRMAVSPISTAAVYTETGGSRVSTEQIQKLQEQIIGVAEANGFPENVKASGRLFDFEIAAVLRNYMPISPAEASRDGVWAHLCCVTVPEVVRWRFPNESHERYLGGRRNTFWRIWRRSFLLEDLTNPSDPFCLMRSLLEDELVQFEDRIHFSGHLEIGQEAIRKYVAALENLTERRRPVFRSYMKRFQRYGGSMVFDAMTSEDRQRFVQRILQESINSAADRQDP